MVIEEKNGIIIIVIEERLDVLLAPTLKDSMKDLVEQGKTKVIIDLAQTKFIDSSGCGALVASLRSLIKSKGDMKIASPSPQAKSLFELTRLHRVFEIYDNLEAAMSSFGGAPEGKA